MRLVEHVATTLKGKKVLVYLITSGLIYLCGLTVPVDKVAAVVMGLVTVFGGMLTGHVVTDLKALSKPEEKS